MVVNSPSRALRAKISLLSAPLDTAALAVWNHPRFAQIYPEYLFHNHAVVRASVPLMKAALERARTLSSSDPVAGRLADYLTQHIPEETNHDEWLVDDLAVLGIDRAQLVNRIPSPAVATLVGSQYYWIFHFHPVALLGYIAVLEGSPPDAEDVRNVARRSGVPIEAFSTMLKHSRLDPYHRDDLDRVLDGLPLTAGQSALLGISALHTVHWLSRVVDDALRHAELPAA